MNNSGPAFPSHGAMGEVAQEGMTLRDYFAAKALQGMDVPDDREWSSGDHDRGYPKLTASLLAKAAYRMADAMIAERTQ